MSVSFRIKVWWVMQCEFQEKGMVGNECEFQGKGMVGNECEFQDKGMVGHAV